MKPGPFRKILFWSHLVCGVVAGAVILVMCVTGVALTYQREVQYWADTRHFRSMPGPGTERAPIAEIVNAVNQAAGSTSPTTITWRSERDFPAAVVVGPRTIYVNPYTAHVYGEGTGASVRAFFATMTGWHRYLTTSADRRATGRAITGASNLMFLFIVLSGI